jgi:hypothetical protein
MDWRGERVKRFCDSVPEVWRRQCVAAAGEALALVS